MSDESKLAIQCPFYRSHYSGRGTKILTCEGFVDDSFLRQTYKRKEDLQQQLNIFCCEYYKKCEIYRMLMEAKYNG